jgi:hypothetical protein
VRIHLAQVDSSSEPFADTSADNVHRRDPEIMAKYIPTHDIDENDYSHQKGLQEKDLVSGCACVYMYGAYSSHLGSVCASDSRYSST